MSVNDAMEAMTIAEDVMEKSRYDNYFIEGAERSDGEWVVATSTLARNFEIRINADSGEVRKFERTSQA